MMNRLIHSETKNFSLLGFESECPGSRGVRDRDPCRPSVFKVHNLVRATQIMCGGTQTKIQNYSKNRDTHHLDMC